MSPQLSALVAVARNGAIGINNELPWHISEDLKRFKKLTNGHTIIMGRKTFESFPSGPLPNRKHIILTRNTNYKAENCYIVSGIDELLKVCDPDSENFVIGGSEIYNLLLPFTSKIYLTRIHSDFQADSFYPDLKTDEWEIDSESEIFSDEKSGLKYQFIIFNRKK